MRFACQRGQSPGWFYLVTFAAIGAFLLTIAISETPRLHQLIHHAQGPGHDCAVTILSGGGVELCNSAGAAPEPPPAKELYTFSCADQLDLISPLDFLLLEHAPPAFS